jgi:alpha-tubulin suppressor-like RCC1 family protein
LHRFDRGGLVPHCAVKSDGSVASWGSNAFGQLVLMNAGPKSGSNRQKYAADLRARMLPP